MPYTRSPLVTSIIQKYTDIIPTLGQIKPDAIAQRDSGGIDITGYEPGTIRREAPVANIQIPGSTTSVKAGEAMLKAFNTPRPSYVGATYTQKQDPSFSVGKAAELTFNKVSEVLQKFDPSSVIGVIKGDLIESAKGAGRLLGGAILSLDEFASSPVFRKASLGQDLTEAESRQLLEVVWPTFEANMQKVGYSDIEKQTQMKSLAMDVFNVGTTAAAVLPAVGTGAKVLKGAVTTGGKALLSEIAIKAELNIGKTAVKETIKAGLPLTVDEAGNVFGKSSTSYVVKEFLKVGSKEVLKFTDDTAGAIVKKTYKQGLILEGVQQMRKYIDPESAERIARDQRDYVDSLSTGERLALDLALGLYLPLEIPGVETVKRVVTGGKDMVARADIARAIETVYTDSKSKQILDQLSKFRDVETELPLDIQLTGDLREHLYTVMKEGDITPTVEHAREELSKFIGKDPSIQAALDRAKAEGTATHLSWYSNKLGRALEPHEQLMHWFITETKREYIGDLGDNLTAEFEKALAQRTVGTAATTRTVYKAVVSKASEVKRLAGQSIRVGETKAIRDSLDIALISKTELMAQLLDVAKKAGHEIIEEGGQFRIPNILDEIPEAKSLVDSIRDLRESITSMVSQAKGLGIPDEILSIKTESELLKEYNAYSTVMGLTEMAASNLSARQLAFESLPMDVVGRIKTMYARTGSKDAILFGKTNTTKRFREGIMGSGIIGSLVKADATDEDVLNFILSIPSRSDTFAKVPKDIKGIMKAAEKSALKMNEVVSRFDENILQMTRSGVARLDDELVQSIVTETRYIESKLPTGAFAPEFLTQQNRWNTSVTAVPLVDKRNIDIATWATTVAKLQDANGVAKTITNYLSPHNPADIYIKAMNKLEGKLEELAPGKTDIILREISKVQDKGISLVPAMPGGGPQWEALGKPMISGVQWGKLDEIGKQFGIDNLGRISRESFVNVLSESGLKPGMVDRLRAAPGVGQLFDSLYRQYMLARFSLNPVFHLQQTPEAALIGVVRSFGLPTELSGKYLKSVLKNPLKSLAGDEVKLYELLQDTDLFAKTAKKGVNITQEAISGDVLTKAARWDEAKRFHAFVAEFPVRVRGELFQMPALGNVDPLSLPEFRELILGLQDNPGEIAKVIASAASDNTLGVWPEAVRRAIRSTNKEVQKFTSYNLNRSALEKDLHAIFFPFSYTKKVWSEVGGAVFSKNTNIITPLGSFKAGGVIKPMVFSEMLDGYEAANEDPSIMQLRARFPTWTGWAMSMTLVNPDYPIVNLDQGSIGLGSIRATPEQAIIFDTVTGGKYDIRKGDDTPLTKIGGYRFIRKELPSAYSEIFRGDTAVQKNRYQYLLNLMELERDQKKSN